MAVNRLCLFVTGQSSPGESIAPIIAPRCRRGLRRLSNLQAPHDINDQDDDQDCSENSAAK